jgi:hypothetical protein
MRNFLKIASGINVSGLLLAITRRPELWSEDTFLRKYPQGPFGEIDSIMLRFPAVVDCKDEQEVELYKKNMLPGHDQHESVDRPSYAALPEARTLVMQIFSAVGGERLGRVMINRISPGGRIYPHADTPIHADYYRRFHLVLQSNPGNVFRCGDEQVHMQTGEVWWFNNKLEHEVLNNSDADRIHMIIDAKVST